MYHSPCVGRSRPIEKDTRAKSNKKARICESLTSSLDVSQDFTDLYLTFYPTGSSHHHDHVTIDRYRVPPGSRNKIDLEILKCLLIFSKSPERFHLTFVGSPDLLWGVSGAVGSAPELSSPEKSIETFRQRAWCASSFAGEIPQFHTYGTSGIEKTATGILGKRKAVILACPGINCLRAHLNSIDILESVRNPFMVKNKYVCHMSLGTVERSWDENIILPNGVEIPNSAPCDKLAYNIAANLCHGEIRICTQKSSKVLLTV